MTLLLTEGAVMKLNHINHIGIIGTGMIGASLAILFTGNGYKTSVYAVNDKEQERGLTQYNTFLQDLIKVQLVSKEQAKKCSDLLNITQSYEDLSDVDFIFECVFERIDVKYNVYKEIEKHCKQYKAIASSTSAISAEKLAEGLVHKEKLLVAHPWNPPHLVPCVEVVKSEYSSDEATKTVLEILSSVGREVVLLKKGAPGFIGNRLQYAMLREAVYMVEQGIASPEDIDRTLMYSFAPRYTKIGIFEHFDNCGLDLTKDIENYLFPYLSNAQEAQDLINEHCEAEEFGIKSNKGMLNWQRKDLQDFRERVASPYLKYFNYDLPE